MLASNNVYSDSLVISSAATLAVAKSLGSKLAIINGDVTITQSSSLSAADLQEVLDVMVTITGNVTYTMVVNSSTQAKFNNLTSVGNLTLDVAGDINFPLLENASVVKLNNTHKNYVTAVEFPVLSTVTSFYTGTTADAIDFPKATAITLTTLKNYVGVASDLTISGKLNFVLDLAALTSKKATGANNKIDLTINGAAELSLPEFTAGKIVANSTAKVVLPKYEGNTSDSFSKATYLHLAAYEQDLTMSKVSTSLDTLLFTGVVATGADNGPTINLTDATGLSTATIDGTINSLLLINTSSLTEVSLEGKANAVTISGASNLETATLDHTAADAELASITVNNNDSLSSLTVSALVSAKSLTITDNDSLETLEFTALKTQGGEATDVAAVNISDNNLTASSIEVDVDPGTDEDDEDGTGTIVTDSGLDSLETYIAAAATRYATTGGSIYVAFDTVESYTDSEGNPTGPIEWTTASTDAKTEIVDLKAATTSGAAALAAKRSMILVPADPFAANIVLDDINLATSGLDSKALALDMAAQPSNAVVQVGDLYTDVVAHLAHPLNVAAKSAAGISTSVSKHYTAANYAAGYNVSLALTAGSAEPITATSTFTIEFNGKSITTSIVSQTGATTVTNDIFGGILADVLNAMDNTGFTSSYTSTTVLAATKESDKYTATYTAATDVLDIVLDEVSPITGLNASLDVTLGGGTLIAINGADTTANTKFRLIDIDYDSVLVTFTATNAGEDYDFTITPRVFNATVLDGHTAFVPNDYAGADGAIYEAATTKTSASFKTYMTDNGATTAPTVVNTNGGENSDNYPKGIHVLPTESTLAVTAAAGAKNIVSWL